jgi:hypothetical protein
MARKVLNRKELRVANDAAEAADATSAAAGAKPAKKVAKKPAARKSRAKTAKVVRLKAFWDVVNQSLKRIARFEYSERKHADKKASEMSTSQKTPHFVQLVKEVIEE